MNDPVWTSIEQRLTAILSMPHNVLWLRQEYNTTPDAAVQRTIADIRSGIAGVPREETFTGPKLFLRVVGPADRRSSAYSGGWWFDADLQHSLEAAYSRIYFQTPDRKAAIRNMLRELLAVSTEWNAMTEVWALELPAGQTLTGFSGPGTPQALFANLPLSAKGNRLLVGGPRQIFFPVKNPLWVKQYRQLT